MTLSNRNSLTRAFALAFAVAPIIYLIIGFDFSTAAWTSDTAEYVQFHPARQPFYGLFYHALSSLGFGLPTIALLQALGLLACLAVLLLEILRTRISLWIFALLLPVLWFALVTHIFWVSTTFISESLFDPLLILACGLTMRFVRTQDSSWLYVVAALVMLMVFTRSAAVAFLPATLLVLVVGLVWGEGSTRASSAKALAFIVVLTAAIPILLGRGLFEIGTRVDGSGFVFISRVVMVSASLPVKEPNRRKWNELNDSFIAAAKSLTWAERSMYESQLQEAVRYYIAPRLFLENATGWSAPDNDEGQLEQTYDYAFSLFKGAVFEKPGSYLGSTASHMWCMLTAGTHLGTTSRKKVLEALNNVDPATWELAKFRSDYPLLRYDIPLKPHTELIYLGFRCISFIATALGLLVSGYLLLNALLGRRKLDSLAIGWLLLTGWLFSHSLLVASSVFPDPRFVMANFVIQWTMLVLATTHLVPGNQSLLSRNGQHAAH